MASKIKKGEAANANRENIKRIPSKAASTLQPTLTKRTALGDVGNKLHFKQNQTINQSKKSETITKPTKTTFIKPPNPVQAKKTTKEVPEKKPLAKTKKEVDNSKLSNKIIKTEKTDNDTLTKQLELIKPTDVPVKLKDEISYSSKLSNFVDIDDDKDPQQVSQYVKDIYNYLLELEKKTQIQEDFLNSHMTSTRMRMILVNWMVDVSLSFGFLLETLHMSVAIVDRYLEKNKNIGRDNLQLVGSTAMYIAGKYEELYCPDVKEIIYICDEMYTKKDVFEMERNILKTLKFDFSRPLSIHFLRRYSKVAEVTPEEHTMGKYFLELCLLSYELCHFRPSYQAAATYCLVEAVFNNNKDPSVYWNSKMQHYSSHDYSSFSHIIPKLADVVLNDEKSKYQTIREKYSHSKFGKISQSALLKSGVLIVIANQSNK